MSHTDPIPVPDRIAAPPGADPARAFDKLVRAHYARLCSFVFRYVDSADAAEDIVQDMLVKVWRRQQQFDFQRPLAYLYQAAKHEAISYRRRHGVRERAVAELARRERPLAPDNATLLERADLAAAVAEAVDALPERCRLIFTMHREQGLTYAQIADVLGLSVKTVETQISRAFRALRIRLAGYLTVALALVSAGTRAS